jgi:hypothetical protein
MYKIKVKFSLSMPRRNGGVGEVKLWLLSFITMALDEVK